MGCSEHLSDIVGKNAGQSRSAGSSANRRGILPRTCWLEAFDFIWKLFLDCILLVMLFIVSIIIVVVGIISVA